MKKFLLPLAVILVVIGGFAAVKGKSQPGVTGRVPGVAIPTLPPASQDATQTAPGGGSGEISRVAEISLTITSPVSGGQVTSATVTVKGKTAAYAEVFVNDQETKADENGNFSVKVTVDEGENTIIVIANDVDGNIAEKELTVTYDSGQ